MPQKKNRTATGVLGGLLGLVGLSAVAGVLVTATVTPAIAMTGLAGSQALDLFEKLPSYLDVTAPMEPTRIYATGTDGKPFQLASFYDQNRVPVTFEQVSPVLYDAILSSEDKNFYKHGGVNLGATVKAVVDNLRGTSSRGASTITQQYVKNVLVQQCEQEVLPGEENYSEKLQQCWLDATNAVGSEGVQRKLEEMRLAIQIEKEYSKNDILLGYLNIANFGGTVYGIEAAANYYFNTTSAKLTVAQAATLAGIVQNPNTYRIDMPQGSTTDKAGNPINGAHDGYKLALDRRNYVLGRMLADGKITQAQYDEAHATPIVPAINAPVQGCADAGAHAYFCQYVRTVIEKDPAFGTTAEERQTNLRRGGLDVYTTLDLRVQNAAVEAMAEWAPTYIEGMQFGAAGVTIEATTGRILAMVQNTIFDEKPNPPAGRSALVYAADKNHGGAIGFSVGSTYKLFTLIDWLEKGHSVNEVLNGKNRIFKEFQCDGEPIFNNTKIDNFGKSGGSTGSVLDFTASSLNSGYLAMAEKLDLCDINRVADRMGVTTGDLKKTTDSIPVPFDVLGSKNIAPLAMAGAYATVANKGVYCTPKAIDKIIAPDGSQKELPASSCTQVLEPNIAATAAYALQRVMNGGTGAASNPYDGTPLIGKTGTHNEDQTMMIESSTTTTTAVWVGNTQGQESLYDRSYNGVQLSQLRHRIAPRIQHAANEAYPGGEFPRPDNNLIRRVLTELPNVVGMSVDEARATLEGRGFPVKIGAPVDSDKPANIVAAQDPAAGQVAAGTTITISPSNGQGSTVPDVRGKRPSDAVTELQKAGFTSISTHASCSPPHAEVENTNPPAGAVANKSTTITITCK